MPTDRQTSWGAGELTPRLYSRGGIAGAKLIKNFIVTPQGTLMNRSGSEYLALLGAQTARLVPFLFAVDEPRLVEIYGPGNVAMRDPFGALVSTGTMPNDTAGDTVSPSRAAVLDALRRIRVAQCAGTIMLGTSPMTEVKRTDATHYTAPSQVSLFPPVFGSSASPFSSANNKMFPALQIGDATITINARAGDATHPPREWAYTVTRVVSISAGDPHKPDQVLETLPIFTTVVNLGGSGVCHPNGMIHMVDASGTYTTAIPSQIAIYGDWTQRIDVGGQAGDPWTETVSVGSRAGTIVAHRVYRGRGGVFGYLGETTERHFVDDGRDPDIANPPPLGNDPFNRIAPPGDWPIAVAFKDDRRMGGGSPQHPQRIWGSSVSDWSNFDEVITPDDSDALNFDLGSNQHEEIRHLLSSQALLAFTALSTWAITGSGNLEVLTPTSIAPRRVKPVGSAHYPAPIEGDSDLQGSGAIFFIGAKGGHPYALTIDGNGAAQLTDLSLLSSHFFEGHTIVDWAWARDPHQILWAVRDDGVLLALTYVPGMQVQGWTQHVITGGLVEAVATLPVGGEDLLYMVVNRGGALSLERLAPRIITDQRFACHLDCALVIDGTKQYAMTVSGISGGGAAPYTLTLTLGAIDNSFIGVDGIGNPTYATISLPDANGDPVYAVVATDVDTAVTATVTGYTGPTLAVDVGTVVAAGAWGVADRELRSTLANGTVVTAYADGVVYDNLTLGTDALPVPAVVRIVGLPFTSQLQGLAVDQERGKQKCVSHVRPEYIGRGGQVGADFDHLQELPPRDVLDGYSVPVPKSEAFKIPVDSSIEETAEYVVQQSQPLPFELLAVEREYVLGG